ncbi:MAG: hypothetical protein ACOCZ9_03875 [Spirochaetota bacterium]
MEEGYLDEAEGEMQLDPNTETEDRSVAELKKELRAKEEYLRTANEELETANEEMQSMNDAHHLRPRRSESDEKASGGCAMLCCDR